MSELDEIGDEVWFFDGLVRVDQPLSGYRAGTDAILLAASLAARAGMKFLELGCGSAVVTLLANYRLPGCEFTAVERDVDMLALARHNSRPHDNISVEDADVANLPKDWHLQFDQVFANPPFFDERSAVRMSEQKAPAFVADDATLAVWISAMLKVLKPRGTGTLIVRADALEKVLHALFGKAGNIRILPIHSYIDEPAKRIIVQFRTGVKSESALLPPLILHDRDGTQKYNTIANRILCGELRINMRP